MARSRTIHIWQALLLLVALCSTQAAAAAPRKDIDPGRRKPISSNSTLFLMGSSQPSFEGLSPVLAAISPDQVLVGSGAFTLTAIGSNFTNGSIVRWNGMDLPTTFVDATQLSAAVPVENIIVAGMYAITIFDPDGGVSNELTITVVNPSPILSAISPDQIHVNSGTFTLNVTGSDFVAGSMTRWDGIDLTTTFIDTSQLSAEVPAENINGAGTHVITIFNPYGGVSGGLVITVINPSPLLYTITPDQITAGDVTFTLVVGGNDFVPASQINWNNVGLNTTYLSPVQLQATVPSYYILNEGTASLSVKSPAPGGGTSTMLPFTISPRRDIWMAHSPEGGIIYDVEVDKNNPSVLYAATSAGGLYKSTDSGQSWFAINNGIQSSGGHSIVVSPANSSVIIAGADYETYLSENGGVFWKKVLPWGVGNHGCIKFDPQNANIVYAAGGGLQRSVDGGKTWTDILGNKIGSGVYILQIAVDAQHSGTVYILDSQNTENGRKVWKTQDDGNTWTQLSNGLPGNVRSLEVHPTNPNILLAGTEYAGGSAESGIYRSEDAGASWTQVLGVGNYYLNIVFNQNDPERVYATTSNAVYYSTDGGLTWQPSSGLADIMTLDVDPTDPALLYGGGYHGMFRSLDGGTTWAPINTGLYAQLITALKYTPQNNIFYAATWTGGLWKSIDYGANWNRLDLNVGYLWLLIPDPNDPNHIYTGNISDIRETFDGGETWEWRTFNPSPHIFGFAANSDLYSALGLKVYKSVDNGHSWMEKSNGLPECMTQCIAAFVTPDPVDAGTIYVGMFSFYQDPLLGEVRTGYLYKTIDGGDNWTAVQNGITNGYLKNLSIDPVERSTLYLSTYYGIFKSTDGGANWTQFDNELSLKEVNVVAVDPYNNQVVYAGTEGQGVYRSLNGGATWSEFNYGMTSGFVRGIVPLSEIAPASPVPSSKMAAGTTSKMSRLYSVSGGQVYAYFSVDYAPTDMSLVPASVPGRMPPGTVVGNFSTSDPNSSDSFTYALVSGEGDLDNASFMISGNTLKTAQVFDQTVKNSYFIRVRSTDIGGLFIDKVFIITITTNSKAPILLTPANGIKLAYNRPDFDWDDVAGASSYTIQISKNQNFSLLVKNTKVVNSIFKPATSLPPNRTLYWRVRMNTASGAGPWSQVYSLKTANPPSIPALVSPASGTLIRDYTPTLEWNKSALPSGTAFKRYELQVDDNNDFSSPDIEFSTTEGIPTETIHTPLADLSPNTRYFWRVRAVNHVAGMEHFSGWSAERSFRTVMLPPTLLLPADGSTEVTLKPLFDWEEVEGATSYTIQISTSASFGTFLVNTNKILSTFTPSTSLPKNKILYWRVRANGANGPSAWSRFQFTTPP